MVSHLPQVIWVCILCRKKQELLTKTGSWMGGSVGDDPEFDYGSGTNKSPLSTRPDRERRASHEVTISQDELGGISSKGNENVKFSTQFGIEFSGSAISSQHPQSQKSWVAYGGGSSFDPNLGKNQNIRGRIGSEGSDPTSGAVQRFLPDTGNSSLGGQTIKINEAKLERTGQGTISTPPFGYVNRRQSDSGTGLASPLDSSGMSGRGSTEGSSHRSDESRTDQLDSGAALVDYERHMERVARNDSLSSDQSESVRPRPPRPHRTRSTRDRRTRQPSLSSSDEEIRSTPEYTSGEDHSENISDKGEFISVVL